jgi:hypothetical protein
VLEGIGRKPVRQFPGTQPVVDLHEGIIHHGVADAFSRQLARQPAVTVAVKLQAKRAVGGHPEIDQPEHGIHEVEVVMQALAAVRADEGLMCHLVVPGFIGIAGLHSRDDMH